MVITPGYCLTSTKEAQILINVSRVFAFCSENWEMKSWWHLSLRWSKLTMNCTSSFSASGHFACARLHCYINSQQLCRNSEVPRRVMESWVIWCLSPFSAPKESQHISRKSLDHKHPQHTLLQNNVALIASQEICWPCLINLLLIFPNSVWMGFARGRKIGSWLEMLSPSKLWTPWRSKEPLQNSQKNLLQAADRSGDTMFNAMGMPVSDSPSPVTPSQSDGLLMSDVAFQSHVCEFCQAVFPGDTTTRGEFLRHLCTHVA